MVADIIKIENLPTFSGQKTDMLIGFSVVGLGYELEQFLIDFFDFENWKVGLLPQSPEKFWIVEIQKFLWQMKVQPKILNHTQAWPPMTSLSTGNDVITNGLIFT